MGNFLYNYLQFCEQGSGIIIRVRQITVHSMFSQDKQQQLARFLRFSLGGVSKVQKIVILNLFQNLNLLLIRIMRS